MWSRVIHKINSKGDQEAQIIVISRNIANIQRKWFYQMFKMLLTSKNNRPPDCDTFNSIESHIYFISYYFTRTFEIHFTFICRSCRSKDQFSPRIPTSCGAITRCPTPTLLFTLVRLVFLFVPNSSTLSMYSVVRRQLM